jgi:hypothetical protein
MEDHLQWKIQWKTTTNRRCPSMKDDLQWKTTSNGRRPSMEEDLQWTRTYNGRRPTMEDNLKIIKVEYLSNHCMYHDLGGN